MLFQKRLQNIVFGTMVETDAAGNIKPSKQKATERIDGIVALIMALDRAIKNEGALPGSVYDTRGLLVYSEDGWL